MKYEIIKGSEKDFEGAPEWATLRTYIAHDSEYFVEKHEPGARVMRIFDRDISEIYEGDAHTIQFDEIEIIAERRPITEPVVNQQLTTEWDGQGLPPVGAYVEYRYINLPQPFVWTPATIKYISKFTVVLGINFDNDQDKESVQFPEKLAFRPIRKPEDVARDEAVNAMLNIFGKNAATGTTTAMQALYDAGYRKME